VLLSIPCPGPAEEEFDFAALSRNRFERIKDSTALAYNWESILNFVATGKGPVLSDLISAYKKPPAKPVAELQHLLATGIRLRYISEYAISGGKLNDDDAKRLATFAAEDCRRNSDSWAAYNAFRALTSGDRRFLDPVKEQVSGGATPFLRAAAAEALGRRRDAELLGFLESALAAALKEEDESARVLLVESLAWAVANTCAPKPKEKTQAPPQDLERLRSLTSIAGQAALPTRTHHQVELALRHALGARDEAELKLLLRKKTTPSASKPRKRGRTVVAAPPVNFMGIETRGERVLFLLDASDSMLKPLTESEKQILRELIQNDVARKAEPAPDKKPSRRGRTVVQRESKLRKKLGTNWDSVTTRFDAARAHLKHTLWKMDSATTFDVLLFGDKSELLKITPRFVKATDKARLLVARELDSIKPGPKGERFPYGRLRGKTNLYSAFELAFRVTTRGVIKKGETYADDRLLTKGADAFFLLSDGQPTVDGFTGFGPLFENKGYWSPEAKAGEITVTDPETGATRKIKVGGSPRRWVPDSKGKARYSNGPFVTPEPLLDDVRRRNLFMRVIIHAVGFGEADYELLKRLAAIGHGRWVWIGKDYNGASPSSDTGR
jgi:hypothetical protein